MYLKKSQAGAQKHSIRWLLFKYIYSYIMLLQREQFWCLWSIQ